MPAPDETEYIASEGGYNLFTAKWEPQSAPKAVVHIVHGYGEHLMRYDDVVPKLLAEGYIVYAHDHYGHGSSDGEKGDIINFNDLVRDLLYLTSREAAAHPNLPYFVLAHSLGCMVALLAALQRPSFARGLILIAPAVALSPKAASSLRIFLGRWVASLLPRLIVMTLDLSKISRDETQLKKIEEDALCFKFFRAKFGVQALNAQLELIQRLQEIKIPFLVEHGTGDAITDISGARLLIEKTASEDKTLIEFPNAYHQLHHELEDVKEETFRNLFEWISNRL